MLRIILGILLLIPAILLFGSFFFISDKEIKETRKKNKLGKPAKNHFASFPLSLWNN
jgi:hypothetical protein